MSMRSYRRRASNCVGLDHENQAQGMFLFAADRRQPARGGFGVTARMAALVALAAAGTMVQAQNETELRVYAAGSLRVALTEVAQAFERVEPGVRVRFTFGASGL